VALEELGGMISLLEETGTLEEELAGTLLEDAGVLLEDCGAGSSSFGT
jgi:hypothetical protein